MIWAYAAGFWYAAGGKPACMVGGIPYMPCICPARSAAAALLGSHTTLETTTLTTGHALHVRNLAARTSCHHGLTVGTEEHLGLHELWRHASGSSLLLHTVLVASLDASFKLALADVLALGKSDIERLVVDHLLIKLGDSLGSLVGVAEANETEAFALSEDSELTTNLDLVQLLGEAIDSIALDFLLLSLAALLRLIFRAVLFGIVASGTCLAHDLGRCDLTIGLKHLAELLIVDFIGQVLDVEVHALVFGGLLLASSFVLLAKFLLAFVLLLGTTNVELLALEIRVMQLFNSLLSVLVVDVVDEAKPAALSGFVVDSERGRSDIAVLLKENTELVLGGLSINVLDVNVGEVGFHLFKFVDAILLGNMVSNVDLLLVQKHAVNALDGIVGSLCSLVVDKAVAFGVSVLVLSDLTAEDIPKGSEGVVESFVVDGSIQILDENIALAGLAQGGVALRPHDAARPALDDSVVELFQSALSVIRAVVVDVSVAERATGDGITADTDRRDLTNRREELEEHSLSDGGIELTDVKRGRVLVSGGGTGRDWGLAIVASGGGAGVDVAHSIGGLSVNGLRSST